MIARLIAWSIARRGLVTVAAVALLVLGMLHVRSMPIDAIPDLSDVQVIVSTDFPGQAPDVIENQVTYPLVTALLGVPRVTNVRGQSMFSTSFVYITFEEGTDLYWARSRVLERLNTVQSTLPSGARSELGRDATGAGWVFQYALDAPGYSQADLRSLQDYQIRYALQAVPGVAEVATLGGQVREYQVLLDPVRLQSFGITAPQIIAAVREANHDVGGRTVEVAGSDYAIRGRGYFRGVSDIANVAVAFGTGGRSVRVGDVADVTMGSALRTGIGELNGKGETVGGVVIMRVGANALDVVNQVKAKLRELEPSLPSGVHVVTTYDRTDLIHRSVHTLFRTLAEESVIVGLVCLLFLLHARSAAVAILTLPLAILASLAGIRWLGFNANIMSLGGIAIAIGAMIDAAVVMLENFHKHIEHEPDRPHWDRVRDAAQEVGPALFMSLLIITVSFLPVFALESEEGRLFRPLALTKSLAMAAAALLSVTLVPVLMGYFVRGKIRPESANPLNRVALAGYRPVLRWALHHRTIVLVAAAVLLAVTILPLAQLGTEFMPPLREGSLMYMPNTTPAVSLTEQRRLLHLEDSILMTFPEVASVWGKAGRANTATDWAPISMVETTVNLKPNEAWRPGITQDGLIAAMDRKLRLIGVANSWTMPIKNRTDMLATGVRTTLGVKIFGPDLRTIQQIGIRIEAALAPLRGTASIYAERAFGGRYLDVTPDADALARDGFSAADVQSLVSTALGGDAVTTTVQGRERYPVAVRYARDFRDSPEAIGRLLVSGTGGLQVPLAEVARIDFVDGPAMIRSENGQLSGIVSIDVRGRDVGGYVAEARATLDRLHLVPAGYRIEWSGQYEALQRVRARLAIVTPIALGLIALLLYFTFGTLAETAIVMVTLPFALIGGIWAMWLLKFNLSVAAAVGFIALAGVAAETGVVMLLYLDRAWTRIIAGGHSPTLRDLYAAIEDGAVNRLRPKLMTVAAIMLGLLPALWATGTGAEVMRPIAAPMVGGMISSTLLTLVVIPVLYFFWRRRALDKPRGTSGDV